MIWKKKDKSTSVKEVVERNSGMKISEFLNPKRNPYLFNLDKATNRIKDAIRNREQITVVTDYDCDGITSAAIMYLLFAALKTTVRIRLPKRFSEGYGLSEKIIDEIDCSKKGLLITVDNGIAAYNEIRTAKERGLDVIVIDHHITNAELPPADIIIDPHIVGKNEFKDYCGAGLAYRLAQSFEIDENVMKKITGIAAIGTVADVVPLVGDNRNIVIDGLKYLNDGYLTSGLKSLLEQLKATNIDESFLGFSLAPIFNAQGRLFDNGASISYRLLASESNNAEKLNGISNRLIETNNTRKTVVSNGYDSMRPEIENAVRDKISAIVVRVKDVGEGVIGILAGKIAEETHRPCFVFTDSENKGVLKGSGRTYGNINIKAILDKITPECYVKYGGHPGAAGVSLHHDKFNQFQKEFLQYCNEISDFNFDTVYYDLEIEPKEINSIFEEVKRYAPYGEGNNSILFRVKNFVPTEKFGAKYRAIGENHIKLFGLCNDAVGFGLYDKFKEKEEQGKWDLLGDMSENTFNGKTSIQFIFRDIQ